MKKIIKIFLIGVILIMLVTPSLFSLETNAQNNDSNDGTDKAASAFEDNVNLDEWYEWFNSLTPEQQNLVNFRPSNFPEKQQANPNPIAPPRLPEYTIDSTNNIFNQDEFITTSPSQNVSSEVNIPTPTPTPIPF